MSTATMSCRLGNILDQLGTSHVQRVGLEHMNRFDLISPDLHTLANEDEIAELVDLDLVYLDSGTITRGPKYLLTGAGRGWLLANRPVTT